MKVVETNTKEEAVHILKEERVWKMSKPINVYCKDGTHEFYRCIVNTKCPIKACLIYEEELGKTSICIRHGSLF